MIFQFKAFLTACTILLFISAAPCASHGQEDTKKRTLPDAEAVEKSIDETLPEGHFEVIERSSICSPGFNRGEADFGYSFQTGSDIFNIPGDQVRNTCFHCSQSGCNIFYGFEKTISEEIGIWMNMNSKQFISIKIGNMTVLNNARLHLPIKLGYANSIFIDQENLHSLTQQYPSIQQCVIRSAPQELEQFAPSHNF